VSEAAGPVATPAPAPGPTPHHPDPVTPPEPATDGLGSRIAALFAVRLVAVVAGFVATVVGARLLGTVGMGAVGQALTVATVAAMLANMGLNISTIFYLQRRAADAEATVARLLGLAIPAALGALVLSVGAIAATAIAGEAVPPLLLATAPVAVGIIAFELSGSLLLGLDRQAAYVRASLIEGVGSLGFTVLLLATVARTPDGFVLAAALGYLAAAGYALIVASRRVRLRVGWDGAFAREAVSFGLRGQVGNLIQFLNLRLDLLLVPVILDLAAAGVYVIAVRMSETVLLAATAAGSLLFPAVAGQEDERATGTTEHVVRATLIVVGAGALALSLVASPLLYVAFGEAYAGGDTALRITAAAMIPLAVFRLLAGDLKGRGRPGLVSVAALIALLVTVAGNLTLLPLLGIEGAALASLLAYTAAAAVVLMAYRRVTGAPLMLLVPRPRDAVQLARRTLAVARRPFASRGGA